MKGRKESNALTFQKCSTHRAMHWPSRKVPLPQPYFDLPKKVPLTVMLWPSRKVPFTESRLDLPEKIPLTEPCFDLPEMFLSRSHALTFQKRSTHRAMLWPTRKVPLTEPCTHLPEKVIYSQSHALTNQRGLSYRAMNSPSRKVPLTEVPLHRPAPLLASVNRKSRVFSSQCEILLSQQVMAAGKVELVERKAGWSYCGVKTKQTNTTKTKQK